MHTLNDAIFGNEWFVTIFVATILLSLAEAGHRIGLRLHITKDSARKRLLGGVQGASLGLLALLLGFTFSLAITRFDTRRELVLMEANSIGTTWLRAGMLPEKHQTATRELLKQYVDVQLNYPLLTNDSTVIAGNLKHAEAIHSALWKIAEAAAKESPTAVTALFITSLNEVIDFSSSRAAAIRNRIPAGVWVLLVVVSGFGCFITGYISGAEGMRSAFTSALLPLLFTVVVALIFDLTHHRQGFIEISQGPLIELKATFSQMQ